MPLRALLLMPSGEQPTIPASKPTSSRFRRSQNPTTPRIISPKDLAAAARLSTISQGAYGSRPLVHDSSSLLNDNSDEGKNTDRWSISSKPLPSPPPRTERDSNQTYQTTLTLPSTSGSSSRSGTDHAPSPPLSPSPTSTSSSRRSTGYDAEGSSAQSKSSGMAIEAIEAKHLRASERFMQSNSSTPPTLRLKLPSIPSERDERGRPILKLNTALSRIGSSLKYNRNESYQERDVSPESESRQSVQPGEQTARKAVSDRIRHLVATTNQSEPVPSSPMTAQLGFSFLSPLSSPSRAASPTHSRPQSLSPSTNRISATPSTALPPATALPPLSGRRFTRRKPTLRRYRIAPAHPPPPPTKGLPPFKFLSDEEMLQLLGEGYIRGMTEGSRVTTGWKQLDA
ncbi:hypothetical protein FRC19_004844 [Serendipita sp. 401]|nr:hypothetical protein FRC19_004844 [Serendipita sp. 401]